MKAQTEPPQGDAADLVLQNARVWTVDERNPEAEALAIRANQILAVGSSEDLVDLTGPSTEVVDLAGQLVLPGFNDAHTHFVGAALRAATAFDLYGITAVQDVGRRLRAHAKDHADAELLVGWRWDSSRFEGEGWPSRLDLDLFEAERAVAIFDIDVGYVVLSTSGLSFLGLGAQPPTLEWGAMITEGRTFMREAWWYVTFPGVALSITVLGFNLLGYGLRDYLDPRVRQT